MATTSSGQYLCQRADERITRRKPIARTCTDSVRSIQPSDGCYLAGVVVRTKESAMMVLSPAAMIAELPKLPAVRDDIKSTGAARYSAVTLKCSLKNSAPLGGIKERGAWEGVSVSDVGACRSLGVAASGCQSSCFTPRHLTCLDQLPHLCPGLSSRISTVVFPPFFDRPGSPPDLYSGLS